jgi:hypothetical protein
LNPSTAPVFDPLHGSGVWPTPPFSHWSRLAAESVNDVVALSVAVEVS